MNAINDFFQGFFAPAYGVRRLLVDSRLRALSILPLLISIFAGSALTVAGLYVLAQVVGRGVMELGGIAGVAQGSFASFAIAILLWAFGLLVLGAAVYMGIRILAAPFYSYLAERTLVALGTRTDRSFAIRDLPQWIVLALKMALVSVVKGAIFGIAAMLLFVLSLVPVLNVLAALGFMHMIAFDISDYAFEAMEWTLKQRFQHVRTHAMTYTGLACGLGLAMSIPGLNLILLPAAVIGASETLHRTLGISREIP